ncbi:MAG: hypothetical protein JSW63_06590 [Ignavibacterium sp.]|nr:MAG: hypothetical protein JSW63_06590 [Ignavibacterium sp.]
MKTSHIFWGTLFIVLGILILANNFSTINLYWDNLVQYWPLVLVLLGISMLVKNVAGKSLIAGAAAVVLALVIFASVNFTTSFVFDDDYEVDIGSGVKGDYSIREYREAYDSSITNAILYLDGGVGNFRIASETDDLIYTMLEGPTNNFNYSKNQIDSVANINLNMKDFTVNLGSSKIKNKVDIALNTEPLWDLDLAFGAASMKFDFAKFKVEDINIDMGAARLDIKLGALVDNVNFNLNAGMSQINITVPEEVGCEINTDAIFSRKNIKDFEKIESDFYRTENFESADKKIFINIDCGVSSIDVRRYSGDDD